ncbi:DUF5694 domain-containing protein [Flavihumibacter sp.]|uniref:DUF5694 domain-containing protein n=1 Tax=Flavihumibacter sp. TaxID=1913981 RepID=UPI002FCBD8A5
MRTINLLLLAFLLTFSTAVLAQQSNKEKEVLLIGTFHFHNPGADIAQTDKFDVLTEKSQKELDIIAQRIKAFAPDKIFVEWDYAASRELDSLYALHLENKYFDYIENKYPKNTFYKENEIFQLAFRAAKLSGNKKVYAIDTHTEFPFDSLLISMERAKQTELKDNIFKRIKEFEETDNKNKSKYSLTQLLLEYNKQSNRNYDLGSYITMFNAAGTANDFTGPGLVANWYKRNLLMYSFVQKLTEKNDNKIVILVGAGHAALFKHFIDLDENFKVVELSDILSNDQK